MKLFLFFSLTIIVSGTLAQHQRIRADFTIKTILHEGTQSLTKGTFYYDNVADKLVCVVNYPFLLTTVIKDDFYYEISDRKSKTTQLTDHFLKDNIFKLVIKDKLLDYGLNDKKSYYKMRTQEDKNNETIYHYYPIPSFAEKLGKVLVLVSENQLKGLIIYSTENKIIKKTLYKNYQINFPTLIMETTYSNLGKTKKKTEYNRIIYDEMDHQDIYDIDIQKTHH